MTYEEQKKLDKAALDALIAKKMSEPLHFQNAYRIIKAAKKAGHVS